MSAQSNPQTFHIVSADTLRMVEENNRMIQGLLTVATLTGQRYLNAEQAAKFIGKTKDQFRRNIAKKLTPVRLDSEPTYDIYDLIELNEKHKDKSGEKKPQPEWLKKQTAR